MHKIISEILLYYVTLVPAANDEIVDAVVTIDLEDVPEDWLSTNLHHRLGTQVGFFRQAGT